MDSVLDGVIAFGAGIAVGAILERNTKNIFEKIDIEDTSNNRNLTVQIIIYTGLNSAVLSLAYNFFGGRDMNLVTSGFAFGSGLVQSQKTFRSLMVLTGEMFV